MMTTAAGPTAYPSSWRPAGAPPPDVEPNLEALMLAIDSYLSALDDQQFAELVARVRNGGQQAAQQQSPQQQPPMQQRGF